MDVVALSMATVAGAVAVVAFTFGLIAFAQVSELKKEVQQLKDQLH